MKVLLTLWEQLEDTEVPMSIPWAKLAEQERGGHRLDNRWAC